MSLVKKLSLSLFSILILFLLSNSAYSKEPSHSGAEWPTYVQGSTIFLNGAMVITGHAVAYTKYSKKYVELENKAKKREIGIWQGEFDMPWEWRRKYK